MLLLFSSFFFFVLAVSVDTCGNACHPPLPFQSLGSHCSYPVSAGWSHLLTTVDWAWCGHQTRDWPVILSWLLWPPSIGSGVPDLNWAWKRLFNLENAGREREALLSGGLKSKLFKSETVRGLVFPHVEKTNDRQKRMKLTHRISAAMDETVFERHPSP